MADVTFEKNNLIYRRATGLLIFGYHSYDGKHFDVELLVCQRLKNACAACWQTPQGGLEEGLELVDNAYKEAWEELRLTRIDLQFVGITPTETEYVLKEEYRTRGFDAQAHRWVVFSYLRGLELPEPTTAPEPEFSKARWAPPMWVVANTDDFRVQPYEIAIPEGLQLMREHLNQPV